jgi:hypothetical protein
MRFATWLLELFRIRRKEYRLASRTQELGGYLRPAVKPSVVQRSKLRLFVKSHALWTTVQVTLGLVIAAWTINNYRHVLHSLFE